MSDATRIRMYKKLADKKYREAFVSAHINTGIRFQIRALRNQQQWTQADLGRAMNVPQSVVSRLEGGKHGPSLETLTRVAAAFDVGLTVRLEPFSQLIAWVENLQPASYTPASFDNDDGFRTVKPKLKIVTAAARTKQIPLSLGYEPSFSCQTASVTQQSQLSSAQQTGGGTDVKVIQVGKAAA